MNQNQKLQNCTSYQEQASPWLLCPSKSFPGKFYYFNGSTGETAWSLCETDKNLKKGPIQRVTDQAHSYPEPFDPPINDSTNTNSSSLKNNGNAFMYNANNRPSHVFGQAVFPKYGLPDLTQNFVWAMTPVHMPSLMSQQRQMLEPEQPMFFPSLGFQAIQRPLPPEFHCQPFEKPVFDQAPTFETIAKPEMRDEACQTFIPTFKRLKTQSESDSTPKPSLKPDRSVENHSFTKNAETSTLSPPSKVDNGKDKLSELDKHDLRYKLMAKKRKMETVVGAAATSTDQSKATKIRKSIPPESVLPKKRVTFDLQESGASNTSSEDVQATDQSSEPHTEELYWYVVVDMDSLLSGLQRIEEFVKSDTSCRLLVPQAVYSGLQSLSLGDSGMLYARKVLMKLIALDNVVVQSKPEYELSTEDSILQCCYDLLQGDHHVILITNKKYIRNKAKTINLECYTLDDIKLDDCIDKVDPVSQIDVAKLKIIVNSDNKKLIMAENDTKKSEYLFMQSSKDINGFSLTKPNGFYMRPPIINIFHKETDNGNVFTELDTNSDKLMKLTRPKEIVKTGLSSKTSTVNNQIVKLGITNSPVRNRTKQTMENVFRNIELNDKICQNPSFDLGKHCNQNASAKTDIDKINPIKNLSINDENTDASNLDVKRLNIEKNQEKSRDIKVSGITKLNNQFSLEEELGRFCIKNSEMEIRVQTRLDEWVCCLSQTMEGALTDLLLKEKAKFKRMMPPKNPLFEAIQATGEIFKKHRNIKPIIDQFPIELISCSFNNGKLKKDLKPNEFMKLVGFSVILMEQLKEIVNCIELYEAAEMLQYLIKNIEDPETDMEMCVEKFTTPLFSRSEIEVPEPSISFRKSRREILEYLKKHFAAWKSETDTVDAINNEPNIVITCGKNLNTLKINNTKSITVENNTDSALATQRNNKKKEKLNANNQPKVIGNVKIRDAYDERRNHAQLESDEFNQEHIHEENESVHTTSHITEIKSEKPDEYDVIDDICLSECALAYPLIRMFLAKLKSILSRILNFMKTSVQEYQEGMSLDKEADMRQKIESTRNYLLKTATRLTNIIARESGDGVKLKHLLIKAGEYVEDDVVVANYKKTVTYYLDQIHKLQEVVQYVLSLPRMRNKVVPLTNGS